MESGIPIFRPRLPSYEAVQPYLREIDESRVYSNGGPLVRQLEEEYAAHLGVPQDHVVAVSNGTTGLTAAVLVLEPTNWIVPAWTFAATPMAVQRASKNVTFADVRKETGALNPADFEPENHDVGYVPVMPFGTMASGSAWLNHPSVVLDAAASIANAAGRLGDLHSHSAVVFSLHATKILGCGEGGLIVAGSTELADAIRSVINFGFDASRSSTQTGLNGKMPEAMAAYALAALHSWDSEAPLWQQQMDRARRITAQLAIDLFSPQPGEIGPYWVITWSECRAVMLDELEQLLLSQGIATRRWWPEPCTFMPAFSGTRAPMPNSEWLARNTVGLPMYVDMPQASFERIESALAAINS